MVQALMNRNLLLKASFGLFAIVPLLAGTAAQADPNPYYLGGSLGVNRVSNVFRQANSDNSDTVTTISLLAGVDQMIGRQHLVFDGTLRDNRYATNTQLDNRGYSLHGQLDWATIERISGTLSASANRQLANYNAGNNTLPVYSRNVETDRSLDSTFRIGLVTQWSAEAKLSHYDQDFTVPEYDSLVYHQNTGSLGLVYRPSDLLRLGLAYRHTTGEYPRYPVPVRLGPDTPYFFVGTQDGFTRNDIDLTATRTVSGASSFNARLSWTNSVHDVVQTLSYKGVTGSIGWVWQPTGKLTLAPTFTRDTGNQVTTLGPSLGRSGTGFEFNATYAVTSKISLTGSTQFRRSSSLNLDQSSYHTNDHSYSLGMNYAYSRNISLNCQAYRTGRDSTIAAYAYDTNSVGCTVQGILY